MIKCPDCNYPNPDDREDCFKCGAKLIPDPVAQPDPAPDPAPAANPIDPTLQMPAATQQMSQQPNVTQQMQMQAPPTPLSATSVDRFCPQCGASVGNANFCSRCGCATLALPGSDQKSNAIASLVMGIIATFICLIPIISVRLGMVGIMVGIIAIFSGLIPMISIPLGAIGLIVGMRATRGVHRKMAIYGMVLSTTALVIAVYWLSVVANIIGSKYD